MPPVPVTFRVLTDDAIPVLVDGVLVQAYTSPGDVIVTEGTTGVPTPSSGEAELTLDSGLDYLIRLYKVGLSYPIGLPITISVLDAPAVNELEVTVHVGATEPLIVLSLKDEADDPIDNVNVKIFDNSDIFLTEGVTSSSGEVDLVLPGLPDPGETYIIRWSPPAGYRIQNGSTQVIKALDPLVPPETNIFDYVAEEIVRPESDDPSMCLLSGYLAYVSKSPIYRGTIIFLPRMHEPGVKVSGIPFPTEPAVLDRTMLVAEAKFVTDRDGYVECKLPQGAVFDIHIYGLETPGVDIISQVYIPESTSAKLEDVLLPYVASVDTEAGAVAVNVGESEDLIIAAVGSNDQAIPESMSAAFLEFTSDDEDIAGVLFIDGILRITGVGAGSATITISRIEGTHAARVPAVPSLVVTPAAEITVLVT